MNVLLTKCTRYTVDQETSAVVEIVIYTQKLDI